MLQRWRNERITAAAVDSAQRACLGALRRSATGQAAAVSTLYRELRRLVHEGLPPASGDRARRGVGVGGGTPSPRRVGDGGGAEAIADEYGGNDLSALVGAFAAYAASDEAKAGNRPRPPSALAAVIAALDGAQAQLADSAGVAVRRAARVRARLEGIHTAYERALREGALGGLTAARDVGASFCAHEGDEEAC